MEVELVGQEIIDIRDATKKEIATENWDNSFKVIVLANGNKLYPSRDYEGNGPGGLFGSTKDGKTFGV